jgi:hypothetical protein
MNKPFEKQTGAILALWALLMLYAGARVLQVSPGKVPIVSLQELPQELSFRNSQSWF